MELTLDRLTREFGPKIAVDRVSATLAPGVYGLLGANGAGKTTLMRMVCGVLRPTSGEVCYDGVPISRMGDAYRALLGYLPQDFGYYPEFTALDFMEYMATLKGLGRRDAHDRSLALLERVGLAGEERRRIRTFSGGMRQRLGIAQAVLNDPEVLVLDEPTAGLDPKERVRFRNLISGFSQDKIVVLSTHIVSDVEHIADEILVMRAGSVVLSGPPSELVAAAEGKVWEATVPAAQAEQLEATLTVGNVRHLEGGCALVRYVADEPRVPGSAPAAPTLEDLYLYVFRDGASAAHGTRSRRDAMPRLILFELKKMLSRRVALAANIGIAVFFVAIMALNVVQTKTANPQGEIVSGTEAIAQMRADAEEYAGPVTAERAAADIAAYQETLFERIDRGAVTQMTGAAVYDLMFQSFSDEEVYELYNSYWSWLLRPWRIAGEEPAQTAARVTPEMAADWYGAVAGLTQEALDDGQGGMWEYSEAEREYWTEKQASVPGPIEYGYTGGWDNIVNCAAFLIFAILAVCVTLAPTFSFEYQSGADAVVLATRRGRSSLVVAKVVAALAYTTAYFAFCAAVVVGVSLAFYGADGFGLSVQSMALSSPYPLTAGQAALISVGLMYAACLGFACFTLAASSRTRSTLSVFLVDVVLVLLTGLIPSGGVGVLERILALFPMNFANFSMLFSALDSYPLGPIALDLIGMVLLVYVVLALVATPVAAVSFRRRQVA